MGRQVLDVTLENLGETPSEALEAVFWELDGDDATVDARFHKEEWFSSTLLEWGACGKLIAENRDAPCGFAQFAPASLFPRLKSYRCGQISPDAVYLAYCYLEEDRRGQGLGTDLVRAVARNLVERGFRALEAIGDRHWSGGWVLPEGFLTANGFRVVREDRRFPLLRLSIGARLAPAASAVARSLGAEEV